MDWKSCLQGRKSDTVANVLNRVPLNVSFWRQLTGYNLVLWHNLVNRIVNVRLNICSAGIVDADYRGDATAPPGLVPPAAAPEEVIVDEEPVEMVPEQEAHVAHEVILADVEPEMPQPRLYHTLMRDYEESPPMMMDDLDDLDDDPNEGCFDMDE
jgi:hypothetical protein